MSAIWGIVNLEGRKIDNNILPRMEEKYKGYVIDQYRGIQHDEFGFGYGGQFFTKESKFEKLPIEDTNKGIVLNADIVLDNREELMDLLKLTKEERVNMPDGSILHRLIVQYGLDVIKKIYGAYCGAIYDKRKQEVTLFTDQVGGRSLYYCKKGEQVYYATLLHSIVEVLKVKPDINSRWVSDYLALNYLGMFTECKETYFEGIYKLRPGTMVTISMKGMVEEEYWNPVEITKIDESITDQICKDRYLEIFHTSVSQIMRSNTNTGILLSGGLDSSAVACVAAPLLKKKESSLYSFTSVPRNQYKSDKFPSYMVNESDKIEITKKHLGNLIPNYVISEGENPWDGAVELMEKLEYPYKSLQNIRWMYESLKEGKNNNCSIMLTGQYGNSSISFGDYGVYYNTLIKKRKICSLIKEINFAKHKYNYSRKKMYKVLWDAWHPTMRKNEITYDEMFEEVYLNKDKIEDNNVEQRLRKEIYQSTLNDRADLSVVRNFMINKIQLSQVGELETKLSLITGVLMRDPTRDPRLLEFCVTLPESQFVFHGVTRRLVREYMKDIMPKEIVEQVRYRGVQSADIFNRLNDDWKRIYGEIEGVLGLESAKEYLDIEKVEVELNKYKLKIPAEYDFAFLKLLYSTLLIQFIEQERKNHSKRVTNM